MLQSSENNISMLGVSESKLGSEIPDSFIQIQDFQCFRKDKLQGSGGLIVCVRNFEKASCSRRKDLENEHFESNWFEIFPKNSKSFSVGHFYRNPVSTIEWNEILIMSLRSQLRRKRNCFYWEILIGIYFIHGLNNNGLTI